MIGSINISLYRNLDGLFVVGAQRCEHRPMVFVGFRVIAGIMQHVEVGADLQPKVLDDIENALRARGLVNREVKSVVCAKIGFDIPGSIGFLQCFEQ